MRVHKSVVGLAVLGLGLGLTTSASGAPAPVAPRAATAIAPANSVNGTSVIDGSLYCADLGAGMCEWFTGGPFDNTVRSATVVDNSLNLNDFSPAARAGLKGDKGDQGDTGAAGANGAPGAKGDQGDKGDTGAAGAAGADGKDGKDFVWSGKHWGTVFRNTIGSGSARLASTATTAPLGDGALEINVASPQDKASFGNEVDFQGQEVGAITHLGYSVYTTGENNAIAPGNMPSMTFEINPHLSTSSSTYSSMVFSPNNSTANTWTALDAMDDSLGKVWGLTGAGMPCALNGARCTWTELQAALNDGGDPATIYTFAVGKGRDNGFNGAVDKVIYNATTFDFEPTGVKSN